jgi:hypothetical protein
MKEQNFEKIKRETKDKKLTMFVRAREPLRKGDFRLALKRFEIFSGLSVL